MTSKYSHGHELQDHRDLKRRGRELLLAAGASLVLCEYRLADVVALTRRDNHMHVTCLEFERTGRNVLRNIRRNLKNGTDCIVEIGMTSNAMMAITQILVHQLTEVERSKVLAVCIENLTVPFLRRVIATPVVDSGYFDACFGVDSESQPLIQGLFHNAGRADAPLNERDGKEA